MRKNSSFLSSSSSLAKASYFPYLLLLLCFPPSIVPTPDAFRFCVCVCESGDVVGCTVIDCDDDCLKVASPICGAAAKLDIATILYNGSRRRRPKTFEFPFPVALCPVEDEWRSTKKTDPSFVKIVRQQEKEGAVRERLGAPSIRGAR